MKPTLYIIMRSDLAEMNPGKGMAQAAHAQADFDCAVLAAQDQLANRPRGTQEILLEHARWLGGKNFGRTIVLSAPVATINNIAFRGKLSGATYDPTYPWKNHYGELQITGETTCAWMFVCDENEADLALVKNLLLHK
jgi:hypothetical protein